MGRLPQIVRDMKWTWLEIQPNGIQDKENGRSSCADFRRPIKCFGLGA
jgi:hypothetical protein